MIDPMPKIGEEIVVVPVLLGESVKTSERKAYICDQQYGKSIVA
jgi:hypothetical protein